MKLGENFCYIFEFKGLIAKVFQNQSVKLSKSAEKWVRDCFEARFGKR